MKRFFNIIPSDNGAACVLLYGEIGEWGKITGADIVRELLETEAQYNDIDVRINSIGGDVYAGIAIYNALKNSKANITIYIDGIAASMAAVIAMCGKPLKMSKYSRLMMHEVSGGAWGNSEKLKQAIEEMEGLNDALVNMIAEKSGLTPEDVKSRWFDGHDHWLTAQEAYDLHLCDEVYDVEPVDEAATPVQLYQTFQNRLATSQKTTNNMFEQIKKRPEFANCATEADVLRHIETLEARAARAASLEARVTEFENAAREALEQEDDTLLTEAQNDGRLQPAQVATYKALLTADRENGRKALAELPKGKRIVDVLNTPDPNAKSPWQKRQEEIKTKFENKK